MSDERVEAIARVLNQADAGNIGVNTWDHINEPTREEYRHMATAVLAALDEEPPLEDVLRDGALITLLDRIPHLDHYRCIIRLRDMTPGDGYGPTIDAAIRAAVQHAKEQG